jgi:hypothetical protein
VTRNEPQPLPIACTLTPGAMADRRMAWQGLADRALRAKRATPRGVELTYAPREAVEAELRELAALEAECCSWATWSVRHDAERVVLEVTAPPEAVGALWSMLAA